jgi:putative tryptophan/tyrosine transport system substrate-binding protein
MRGLAVALLSLALLAAPLGSQAQPPGKVYRIGLFHVGLDHVPPSLDSLREGLKTLGYDSGTVPVSMVSSVMEGKNIRLDWRNLPDEAVAHETAREFVRQRVDLIVAFENRTVRAVKAATSEIPVVFLHVTDPVADGFVKSLAHPGGNVTGMSGYQDLTAKHLELFKALVPRLRRMLVLTYYQHLSGAGGTMDRPRPAGQLFLASYPRAAPTTRLRPRASRSGGSPCPP